MEKIAVFLGLGLWLAVASCATVGPFEGADDPRFARLERGSLWGEMLQKEAALTLAAEAYLECAEQRTPMRALNGSGGGPRPDDCTPKLMRRDSYAAELGQLCAGYRQVGGNGAQFCGGE